MQILIPKELAPLKSINFACWLSQLDNESIFTYDFKNMQHCHPYGLLVVATAIRNNMKRFPCAKHEFVNTEETQGGRFAAEFGFYQSLGVDIGYAKEEDEVGDRYIPIKKISAAHLHEKYADTTLLNEKVNRHAAKLSQMLVGYQYQSVLDAIQYCFREIMRNTFEHAKTNELWVCGQYWPSREEAEIAVLDEGIGILKSLQTNKRIIAKTCAEANSLALQPGLSCTLGTRSDSLDFWQNSGYGLYVASTLCAINGGYFILSSGDSALLVNGREQQEYKSFQTGTAICVNIRLNSKKLQKFDDTLSAIVKEGEEQARKYGENRISTASKVTTIASMVQHIEKAVQASSIDIPYENGPVPINEVVFFQVIRLNGRHELEGVFEYDGQQFPGVLLNVSEFNRKIYVNNKMKIQAIVRKLKKNRYNLLELHSYNKQLKRTR